MVKRLMKININMKSPKSQIDRTHNQKSKSTIISLIDYWMSKWLKIVLKTLHLRWMFKIDHLKVTHSKTGKPKNDRVNKRETMDKMNNKNWGNPKYKSILALLICSHLTIVSRYSCWTTRWQNSRKSSMSINNCWEIMNANLNRNKSRLIISLWLLKITEELMMNATKESINSIPS